MTHDKMTRRECLGIVGSRALLTPLLAAACSKARNDCEDISALTPAERRLRQSLAYTAQSPHADKRCDNCQPFTPAPDQRSCGSCALLRGPIDAEGYCNSWVPKPT